MGGERRRAEVRGGANQIAVEAQQRRRKRDHDERNAEDGVRDDDAGQAAGKPEGLIEEKQPQRMTTPGTIIGEISTPTSTDRHRDRSRSAHPVAAAPTVAINVVEIRDRLLRSARRQASGATAPRTSAARGADR
jgi:hypothetical protein